MLFGGAAGPGKTDGLLMAALLYVDEPNYNAIMFRRTYPELESSLIPRSQEWLAGKAHYNSQQHRWTFPSGAKLTFAHLQTEKDKYLYQSAEFHGIFFDELTGFSEKQFTYLFSRLRRTTDSSIPLRVYSASNPGGEGHEWVKARFIDESAPGRRFIPAVLEDNPHLDAAEYERSLAELDPVTRQQLRHGDWTVRNAGGWFDRTKFRFVDQAPTGLVTVRYWDLAATEAKPGKDPDWTVGTLLGKASDGNYYVLDVVRFREAPARTEAIIKQTAAMDGYNVAVYLEQEPGSSGVIAIDHYRRRVLTGYSVWPEKTTGDKASRARPWSAAVDAELVHLVRAPWNRQFIEEHEAFPQDGVHDDQVDSASGAFTKVRAGSGAAWMEAWERMAAQEHQQRLSVI